MIFIKIFQLISDSPPECRGWSGQGRVCFQVYLGERVRGFCFMVRLSPLQLNTPLVCPLLESDADLDTNILDLAIYCL